MKPLPLSEGRREKVREKMPATSEKGELSVARNNKVYGTRRGLFEKRTFRGEGRGQGPQSFNPNLGGGREFSRIEAGEGISSQRNLSRVRGSQACDCIRQEEGGGVLLSKPGGKKVDEAGNADGPQMRLPGGAATVRLLREGIPNLGGKGIPDKQERMGGRYY